MEAAWFAWCRTALRLCRCDDGEQQKWQQAQQQQRRAPPLVCYYSLSDELVKRQLEFRKTRRVERIASYSSLSSLATVSETDDHPENVAAERATRVAMSRNVSMPATLSLCSKKSFPDGWGKVGSRTPPYPVDSPW